MFSIDYGSASENLLYTLPNKSQGDKLLHEDDEYKIKQTFIAVNSCTNSTTSFCEDRKPFVQNHEFFSFHIQ